MASGAAVLPQYQSAGSDQENLGGCIPCATAHALQRAVDEGCAQFHREKAVRDRTAEVVVSVVTERDVAHVLDRPEIALDIGGQHPPGGIDHIETVGAVPLA